MNMHLLHVMTYMYVYNATADVPVSQISRVRQDFHTLLVLGL